MRPYIKTYTLSAINPYLMAIFMKQTAQCKKSPSNLAQCGLNFLSCFQLFLKILTFILCKLVDILSLDPHLELDYVVMASAGTTHAEGSTLGVSLHAVDFCYYANGAQATVWCDVKPRRKKWSEVATWSRTSHKIRSPQ